MPIGAESGFSQVTAAIAAGELVVASTTEFADLLQVDGISGTSLRVDDGATAIFNDAATAIFGQDVTLGDAERGRYAGRDRRGFLGGGNMTLAARARDAGGSAADVLGALSLAGTLEVGVDAAANVALGGSLQRGGGCAGGRRDDFCLWQRRRGFCEHRRWRDDHCWTMRLRLRSSSLLVSGALTLGGVARVGVGGLFAMVPPAARLHIGHGCDAGGGIDRADGRGRLGGRAVGGVGRNGNRCAGDSRRRHDLQRDAERGRRPCRAMAC